MAINRSSNESCLFLTYNYDQIDYGRVAYMTACVLATAMIIPSMFLNILLLISMHSSAALRKPSTLLLYSLSVSDLLIAVALLPVYLLKKIAELSNNFSLYCPTGVYTYIVGYLLSTVSLFTMTFIAIDRYLIVHSGVKYPEIITRTRLTIAVTIIWITAMILSSGQLYFPRTATFQTVGVFLAICITITATTYIKTMYTLKTSTKHARELSESSERLSNVARYRKSTATMLIVFVVFLLCYFPYFCVAIVIAFTGEGTKGVGSAESIATSITYARSCINPVILFLRIREIQTAAKLTLRTFCRKTRQHEQRSKNGSTRRVSKESISTKL